MAIQVGAGRKGSTDRFDVMVDGTLVVGSQHSIRRPSLEARVAKYHPVQRQAADVFFLLVDFKHVRYLLSFHYILWNDELIDVNKSLNSTDSNYLCIVLVKF